jgi:hypothetical protein
MEPRSSLSCHLRQPHKRELRIDSTKSTKASQGVKSRALLAEGLSRNQPSYVWRTEVHDRHAGIVGKPPCETLLNDRVSS